MGRRELKKSVLMLLAGDNVEEIEEKIAEYREVDVLNPLFSALCSVDERVRWHAVSAFGSVVSRLARQDMEAARIVMRRFLWSLNDESGGIGWGAPEAMAESMLRYEPLAREYLHMLVSYMQEDGPELFQDGNYIELPQLQQGVLWGVGRLCPVYGNRLRELGVVAALHAYLHSEDGSVRGLAVWCLALLAEKSVIRTFPQLADDQHVLRLYRDGRLEDLTVAELAADALRTTS
jgi:HEAT repeat protein